MCLEIREGEVGWGAGGGGAGEGGGEGNGKRVGKRKDVCMRALLVSRFRSPVFIRQLFMCSHQLLTDNASLLTVI